MQTFAVLVHAGGVGSEEEADDARPSERRFRWQWREPPLARRCNVRTVTLACSLARDQSA
jgi:hypothetical protein